MAYVLIEIDMEEGFTDSVYGPFATEDEAKEGLLWSYNHAVAEAAEEEIEDTPILAPDGLSYRYGDFEWRVQELLEWPRK